MRKKWIMLSLLCAVLAIGLEAVLILTSVCQEPQVSAYVLTKTCEANTVIEKGLLSEIKLSQEAAKKLQSASIDELIGVKLTQKLMADTLLTKANFNADVAEMPLQTMIVKLNPEQSHCGQLALGEIIDLICYRQGSVIRLENLKVAAVAPMMSETGNDGSLYLTLAGSADQLETLLLSQQEGVVTILKKTAVQIP